ncbi:MAG: hypothetical protein IPL84_08550 [Chitinophagaceae bacterium]|nr:hypothetical protein [Chitinophagaceae bacterium]
MKHYAPYALSVLLTCVAFTGFSQNTKPKQFDNFPATIQCSEPELAKVFDTPAGQNIQLVFSNNFIFQGSVKSNLAKYDNLQSAIVISPDYPNTIFSVSRITNADRSTSYVGRILNRSFFDGFELKRNTSGSYELLKIETDRLVPDCAHL